MDLDAACEHWKAAIAESSSICSAEALEQLRSTLPAPVAGPATWDAFLDSLFATPPLADLILGSYWPLLAMRQAAGPNWAPLPFCLRLLSHVAKYPAHESRAIVGLAIAQDHLWIADHLWSTILPWQGIGQDGYWTACTTEDGSGELYDACLAADPTARLQVWPTLALTGLRGEPAGQPLPDVAYIGGPGDIAWIPAHGVPMASIAALPGGPQLLQTAGMTTVLHQLQVQATPALDWTQVAPLARWRLLELARSRAVQGSLRSSLVGTDLTGSERDTLLVALAPGRPRGEALALVVAGIARDFTLREEGEPDGAWLRTVASSGPLAEETFLWFRLAAPDFAIPVQLVLDAWADRRLLPRCMDLIENAFTVSLDGIACLQGGLAAGLAGSGLQLWRPSDGLDDPLAIVLAHASVPPPPAWVLLDPETWLEAVATAVPRWSYAAPLAV